MDLPHGEGMRRLNKARATLKHNGTLPSKLDTEAFRAAATGFFTEACPMICWVPFEASSLVEHISNDDVREHLEKARAHSVGGASLAATYEVAVSYATLTYALLQEKDIRMPA